MMQYWIEKMMQYWNEKISTWYFFWISFFPTNPSTPHSSMCDVIVFIINCIYMTMLLLCFRGGPFASPILLLYYGSPDIIIFMYMYFCHYMTFSIYYDLHVFMGFAIACIWMRGNITLIHRFSWEFFQWISSIFNSFRIYSKCWFAVWDVMPNLW